MVSRLDFLSYATSGSGNCAFRTMTIVLGPSPKASPPEASLIPGYNGVIQAHMREVLMRLNPRVGK